MTVVYSVSFDCGLCELYCAGCGKTMDRVEPDVVSALTRENASPCCMNCDADVADSVPWVLWPEVDGQVIVFVNGPARRAEFKADLPVGYPSSRPGARPSYTPLRVGWAESLSGKTKVNTPGKRGSLKKGRAAKRAKKKRPQIAERQSEFWSGY